MKSTHKFRWMRLLALVLVFGLVMGCLGGCSENGQSSEQDEDEEEELSEKEQLRESLTKHKWEGMTFYLSEDFEETDEDDDDATYTGNKLEVIVGFCLMEEVFGETYETSRDFAEGWMEVREGDFESMSLKKANDIYYVEADDGETISVTGFYVMGDYGWGIVAKAHPDDYDTMRQDMINYATLGQVKKDYVPESDLEAEPDAMANTIEIKVWTPAEDQAEGNNWLVKMEKGFAAAHPEWKIMWVNESMPEGDAAGLVTGDVAASADVYMFANDHLGALITAGGLTKLGGVYKEQVENDNTDFMKNTVTYTDGEYYGFPIMGNTWFLYYNKDVFTEEDVKSLDTMLTKGQVVIPFNVGWNAGCFFLGCGGTVFGEKGNDPKAGIQFGKDNGGYIAARKMVELKSNFNVITGGMDVGKLIDGEAAAAFSGSWDYAWAKDALGDKLGVAMLPKFTAEGKEYQMKALSGSKCIGVNPNCGAVEGKQLVCTEFAAYLASEEAQLERYVMRGVIPAARNLARNADVMANPVAMAHIQTLNEASVVQSSLPEMAYYWDSVETFVQQIICGEITEANYERYVDEMMWDMNP